MHPLCHLLDLSSSRKELVDDWTSSFPRRRGTTRKHLALLSKREHLRHPKPPPHLYKGYRLNLSHLSLSFGLHLHLQLSPPPLTNSQIPVPKLTLANFYLLTSPIEHGPRDFAIWAMASLGKSTLANLASSVCFRSDRATHFAGPSVAQHTREMVVGEARVVPIQHRPTAGPGP